MRLGFLPPGSGDWRTSSWWSWVCGFPGSRGSRRAHARPSSIAKDLRSSCCHACLSPPLRALGRVSLSRSSCCHARASPLDSSRTSAGLSESSCCHAPASPLHSSRTSATRLSGSSCCPSPGTPFHSSQQSAGPSTGPVVVTHSKLLSIRRGSRRVSTGPVVVAHGLLLSTRRGQRTASVGPVVVLHLGHLLSLVGTRAGHQLLSRIRSTSLRLRWSADFDRHRLLSCTADTSSARVNHTAETLDLRSTSRVQTTPADHGRTPRPTNPPRPQDQWSCRSPIVVAARQWPRRTQLVDALVRRGIRADRRYTQWSPPLCAARTLGCPGEIPGPGPRVRTTGGTRRAPSFTVEANRVR